MIQDIAPHTFSNEYTPGDPRPSDFLIIIDDRRILLDADGAESFSLPRICDLKRLAADPAGLTYLFSIDRDRFFFLPGVVPETGSFRYVSEMQLRELEGDYLAFGAATAVQLAQWYSLHQYCGKCGIPTIHSKTERAIICPKCGHIYYPRISPVVIIAITKGDRILLTKYNRKGTKRWSLVAGFVEIGETLEDAVRREVMEEVGLQVKNIRYIESQPWAFSSSLISGFRAEVDGDPTIHLNTDGKDELASAEWIPRDKLVIEDHSVSLTWDMIYKFREEKL